MHVAAHRTEAVLEKDGVLVLENLPFHAGDEVEIIVVQHSEDRSSNRPLREATVEFQGPTEPVADEHDEAEDPAEIAQWIAEFDSIPPPEMTAEEEAQWQASRKAQAEFEAANQEARFQRLRRNLP